jgi:hypothetical protein
MLLVFDSRMAVGSNRPNDTTKATVRAGETLNRSHTRPANALKKRVSSDSFGGADTKARDLDGGAQSGSNPRPPLVATVSRNGTDEMANREPSRPNNVVEARIQRGEALESALGVR